MAASRQAENLKACSGILKFLMAHKDAGPFLEPVKWKEWGLSDYPKIIKNPMDLGTVKAKLESNAYSHPKEFKHDVNLVWNNCMTYNADGSEYYTIAGNLKKVFEEKYQKTIKEDEDVAGSEVRPPTLMDKKMFSQNVYNISSEDLGKVVHILDARCEACIRKIDPEDIEIDIDSIDPATFWQVDEFVKQCLPGAKKTGGAGGGGAAGGAGAKPKAAGGAAGAKAAGAASASSAAAAEPSKAKKARVG